MSRYRGAADQRPSSQDDIQRYDSTDEVGLDRAAIESPYRRHDGEEKERSGDGLLQDADDGGRDGLFRDEDSMEEEDGYEMSISELLYSTSSFHAIMMPGKESSNCRIVLFPF
jgi:hypothetical protein